MDDELPPWNKHGSHNSRVPYNIAGERQEDHNLIGDSFAAGEPMSSLSSCMSGAFKALLPDYHGTSSEMTTNSAKYSYSPSNNCLIKPGTAVDEKIVVERREKSDFLKDPLCEPSASVTPMLPPRCAQYVPPEKHQDQGNCIWTSVIKDSLEMSNGMEMEQSLSMGVCGPLMGLSPVYKGSETEAKFTLKDHYQIEGSKLSEKQDGQGVKGEPDSFISMLSDGISKKKDVLEMGGNDEPRILDVGTSQGTDELGMTGIRENDFNRSSYNPFSSSEGFMKHEEFLGIPSLKQSVEHPLQGTTQGSKTCKDVSPRKTAGTNIVKHATVNNETAFEGSSVYGLHHLDLQKDFHQAEVTDGNTINSQDHSFEYDVQDKRLNTINLHGSETTLIAKSAACLPDTQCFGSKLKKQDHDLVPSPASLDSHNTAVVECENSKLQIPTEDRTSENSLSVPGKMKTLFQKTFCNTNNAEPSQKVETGSAPEIQSLSSGSETVPDKTVISNKIHLDYKCKDSPIEPGESGKLNTSTVLLPCDEKVQNSAKIFLNISSENSIPPPTENIHAAPPSLTSRIDCSSQPNLQKALQTHKKSRKRKKSELEELIGPIHGSKRDDCSVYGSEISDSAVKPDTIRCEDTYQNFSLTTGNHDHTSMKEEGLIKNVDVNPSSRSKSLCHSQQQMTHLELVADTAETSQKPDHSCSETSQVKVPSTTMIGRKADSRRKLKNKRLRFKAKKSARLGNQCLSQEERCTSHFQVSEATLLKGRNPEIIQQPISRLASNIAECSPKESTKKKTLQTLQSKGELHDDPTTFSEVEADLMDSKRHQKVRRPGIKASKGKDYEHATSLLNSQSLLESVSQTDSVSSSVTEYSNILSPEKTPKKSRQKKRADNKATKSPQEDIPLKLSKTKEKMGISNTRTVKAKIFVKKATRTDDCDTTLLDMQHSIDTLKQTDSVPTVGIKVQSPVVLHMRRKSLKKKLSDVHIPTVDQTPVQQSVLNPLSESDASIVQPTMRRFSPRKTLDTVNENCETAHLNESISSVDSMSATLTDISGVSLMNTEKTSNKWRKTNIKFMEEQTSTTSQKEDVIVLPSEDLASIVVSNSEKNVKVKKLARNNTNDTHLNHLIEETSLLAFVMQENSISPSKIDCSNSVRQTSTLKKPRKTTTTTKNKAEEMLNIKQHENFVAVALKPSANMVASSSQMTLKEKRPVENAITEEVKASTATLQHIECVSDSFARTPKKSKKMSEAVYTSEVDQSMQQELHPLNSVLATEMDNSDIPNQKKIKVKTKRKSKKVTKRKTCVTQATSSIGEQSFPDSVQQEYSISNRNTNSRSEELTKKHKTKKTTLKVRNVQAEDHAEHPMVLSALLPRLKHLGKDATHDPWMKTDVENESAESQNQVFITNEDVACSQSLLKKAKKMQDKQLPVQKEDCEQSNILELAHREDKKSDLPSVVQDVAFENFESLEANSCDQQKKAKKSKKIEEMGEFANVSLSQEKNTGSDETGVMVTFTQIQDFCKLHDGQTIGSEQSEKDEIKEESTIKDLKAPKIRTAGRKRRKIAGLLTQTVSPEESVIKSRKSTCTQKSDLGPFVENVSTQGSLDITEYHTRLGETLSGSMQPAGCEDQYTFDQKSPRRGRPHPIKNKKQKLSIAHLEENTSPSVQISDLSSCQDGTETLSSSIQPADCEGQYTIKQKSPRRGRPPSIKNKKQKLSIALLEGNASPSAQILDVSSCQDGTDTLSSFMQPADCEGQYTKQKSPRRGRPPSIKSKKQKLSIAHLEDNTSPTLQILDASSCKESTETLSSSIQPADCEGQYTIKQKSPRRGRPLSIKSKNQKLSIANLEDDASPSVHISDLSCQDGTETLSSSMEPADCKGQYTINQKSPIEGRTPPLKTKKQKSTVAHLEDNASPSVQISDLSSCQDGTETLSSSMQPADCEGQYTIKQNSPRRGRPPSNKSKKYKLSMAHLEDNASPSVQISDLSSCQDGTAILSSSIQPADCEGQYTNKQKSPRQGRPPSNKSKKHKLSMAHLEDGASPAFQTSDLSSCQDGTATLSSSIQPADCEGQYTIKKKSPRQGRSPSNKSKKHKLSMVHLEDNTSPSVQISDLSSCQDGTATLSSSIQPTDCEGQNTIKQKSLRQGRSPSNKSKKHKLSIAHLEDNSSQSVHTSDLSSCQDSINSKQPADCEGQNAKQKSPRRGRPPSIKNKKPTLSITYLEDNNSPLIQISDLSSSQDSTETLSSSMQPADCEGQYTKKKSPRRGRPPSIKNKKPTLSIVHLEDNASPSVQISDLSLCQESTENKVKAAASPAKRNVVQPIKKRKVVKVDEVTRQLGNDPSESLQSLTDDVSHNIPVPKHKKGKNFKRFKVSSLRVSSRNSEPSVKGFQKADIHSLPQNPTNDFNEEGKTYLPMLGTAKKQKLCEKTAILDGDVLTDMKIENKAKVVKGGKRGRKRRKIKEPPPENNKGQDCSETAKSLLTEFSITNKCSTGDQNNIVTSEINDVKTKLSIVEMIPAIPVETCQITPKTEVLCSSSTHLSSNLMKVVKYKEHNAEPNGKDLFAVIDKTGISNGVSSGISNLISSNVDKEDSENVFLDTKIKPNIELKTECTPKKDGQSVEMSGEMILSSFSEIENAVQTSTEQKVDGFTQDSEECVVMPMTKRTMRSKPKEMMKKPLTCKYCGVSFRHITAYVIHQRIHTGEKPYKCKNCGKTFAQLSKLKSHRNVHKQDASFPCPCCSQRFLQKEKLLSHFKVHLQESKTKSEPQKDIKSKKNTSTDVCSETTNNYRCLICKKIFVNQLKLENHMQTHEVEKPLTCKDCGKKFWKPSSLAAHEKSHWPVKPYACSICGKGFNQLKALKKHSQDHAGETPFSCFHCGHGFSALSALRMHQASKTCIARRNDGASSNIEGFIVSQGVDGQVNTPVFFKCQICKQLFRKWCQYTLHLQTHTSSPPYICFSCGQCYEKDSEMNVHCEVCCQSSGEEHICGASLSEIMQGVTQTYPIKCTSSQTLPSTGFQLNSQTQTSSEQLPQLPKLMDVQPTQTKHTDPKAYSTQSPINLPIAQLPTHSDVNCTSTSSSLEYIEVTQSLWKFKCSHCGQRFERYRTLSAHLQMHASGFRYTCGHCGQFFERWSKLWLHQRRHRLKSRSYSCNQCNLQFRFFRSFKEHMIDHAGQRQYACPLCPETFIQEASLHAHQCESHKLCKSLKCDVCSKTFSSLSNLIKHSLLHNGSTSHICLPCNLSFTNTRVLKEHLKTHTTTYPGPALPDIPSKPLDFPHKCKRCKASFSTGDLLYAHLIRHSRDAKTHVHPAVAPTSKLSDSCDAPSTPSSTRRNHISNLKLDDIPNDESLYVYSHPDRLYVPHSRRVQIPVINLDPDEQEEASATQNTSPELPTTEVTAQSDSTHLPQATAGQETTNLKSSESIKEMENDEHNCSHKLARSVDMEVDMTAQEEESLESFECADCTEKLSSVLSLYEHYILHALGDAYVQVH